MYPIPPELNNHEISRFGELYVDKDDTNIFGAIVVVVLVVGASVVVDVVPSVGVNDKTGELYLIQFVVDVN